MNRLELKNMYKQLYNDIHTIKKDNVVLLNSTEYNALSKDLDIQGGIIQGYISVLNKKEAEGLVPELEEEYYNLEHLIYQYA